MVIVSERALGGNTCVREGKCGVVLGMEVQLAMTPW